MSKYYEREEIDRKIKRDIPNIIRDVLIDLMEYFSVENYDVEKAIDRINSADYIVNSGKPIHYEYEYRGKKQTFRLDKKKIGGFFKPIIVYDGMLDGFVLVKKLVVVNILDTDTLNDARGKIIHEVLHLISSKDAVEKTDETGVDVHYSGLVRYYYSIQGRESSVEVYNGESDVNEAVTDTIRYSLMERIYGVPFTVKYDLKDNKKYYYLNAYYLMNTLMSFINFAITREKDTKELEKIYLANDIDELYDMIEIRLGMGEDTIKSIFVLFKEFMLKVYGGACSSSEVVKFLQDRIMPVFRLIFYNFYITLEDKAKTKEEKIDVSVFLDNFEKHLVYLFDLPLMVYMKEEFMLFVTSIRKIYG